MRAEARPNQTQAKSEKATQCDLLREVIHTKHEGRVAEQRVIVSPNPHRQPSHGKARWPPEADSHGSAWARVAPKQVPARSERATHYEHLQEIIHTKREEGVAEQRVIVSLSSQRQPSPGKARWPPLASWFGSEPIRGSPRVRPTGIRQATEVGHARL